jgi:uncharacterized membrane protein YkvA (DUF1232 family)
LESQAASQAKDPLPRRMAETGFAAGYLLKGFDLIPDHVAEIGLADDALILQRVVCRNKAELQRSLAERIELAVSNDLWKDRHDSNATKQVSLKNALGFVQTRAPRPTDRGNH